MRNRNRGKNKYIIRRRITIFSILVCVLSVFCVLNKSEINISKIAGSREHRQLGALVETYDISVAQDNSITATIYESDTTGMHEMIIEGTGEMKSYEHDTIPYVNYKDTLIKAEIKNGVTRIGDSAFYGFIKLSDITIPETVTAIGEYTFNNCESLSNVTIPENVTYIGGTSFAGCTALTDIIIPDGVETIRSNAFDGCTNLVDVTMGKKVTVIENNAFANCTSLENITIPESVTKIGTKAFSNCTSLSSINIPNNVTIIGSYAFEYCENLADVTIGTGVENIEFEAFRFCNSLTNITIPSNVNTIGVAIFDECAGLQHIYCQFSAKPENWDENWYGDNNENKVIWLLPTSIAIKENPQKVEYKIGEMLNITGLEILATYLGRTEDITIQTGESVTVVEIWDTGDENPYKYDSIAEAGIEISGFDNTQIGTQTITVKYKEQTATFEVIVRELIDISTSCVNMKTEYNYGETLNLEGLEVNAIYSGGYEDRISEILAEGDYTVVPSAGTVLEPVGSSAGNEILTQEITVTYEEKTATFTVEVTNEVAGIEITGPTKTTYIKGEDLDLTGAKLILKYQDGSTTEIDITEDMVSGYEKGKTGEQELTVEYDGKTANFTVEVTNRVTGLEIVQIPSKTVYAKGQELELSDGRVKVTFEDGSSKEFAMNANGIDVNGYDANKLGSQTLTVSYKGQTGKTATFTVEVTNKVTEIELTEPTKTTYVKGEELDLTDAQITVTYEDGSTEEKDVTSSMVSGYNKNQIGGQTVTVTYEGKEATFDVTVMYSEILPDEVESIEISGDFKKDYKVGDTADLSGMVINVTCKDGSTARVEITEDGVNVTCNGQTKTYDSLEDAGIVVNPSVFQNEGKQDVTVTYEGKEATFEANVDDNSDEIVGAELVEGPDKTRYEEGETLDLSGMKVEITYADGSKETIEFKENGKVEITANGEKTEYDSAEDAGITIEPSDLNVGTYDKIEITYKDKEIELPVTIVVTEKIVEVTGIELDKTEVTIEVGNTATFVATITPEEATDKNVTWTSSDETVAEVSDSGVVTAKKVGTATITVTSDANTNIKAEADVTVTAPVVPEPPKVDVTGVTLNKTETTIQVGQMEDLVCTIAPANATNKKVTWSSSDEEKVVVDENGTILALSEGQVTITVTSEDGRKTATCIVNVEGQRQDTNVEVTGVTLDKSVATIKVGATEKLIATILPENATNKKVTWSSSDETVATVEGGIVTALKAGNTTITVTTEDGRKTATCEVTVEAVEVEGETVAVTGVSLNKSKATVKVGNTETLTATILPANATNKNITWSSSDESVATVKGGVITAHKAGKAIITVTTEDGKKTANCEVIVVNVQAPSDNKDDNKPAGNTTNTQTPTNKPAENTQKPDTSPNKLPAAGKGMLTVVIGLISIAGVIFYIKYRNIDR